MQAFTLHTQCTNLDMPPEQSEITCMIRDISFKELAKFMGQKLKSDCSKDLVLVAGDFNVFRYPCNDHTSKMLFIKDKRWPNYFELIDKEYDRLVQTLQADGKNEIVNLWERDNPGKDVRCVTVGDVVQDSIKEDGSK